MSRKPPVLATGETVAGPGGDRFGGGLDGSRKP